MHEVRKGGSTAAGQAATGETSGSRRVAINSALQGGADAIGKFGLLLLYVVMARKAGPEAFGDFTSASSLAFLILLAGFGMDFSVTRRVARGEESAAAAFWSAVLLKLLFGVVGAIIVVTVAVVGPYDDRVIYSTALIGAAVVVELSMLTPQAVFRGKEDLRPVATALIIARGSMAFGGIVLLLAGASVVAVAGGWLVSTILGLAYSAHRLRNSGHALPREISRESLSGVVLDSMGIGLAGVFAVILARLDIVILGFLKDSIAVAYYGSAYRLVESVQFVTTAVGLASFPVFARLSRTSTPTIGEAATLAAKAVLIVSVPTTVVFGLYAGPLIEGIYGPELDGATSALQIMAVSVPIWGLSGMFFTVLAAQQRQLPINVALAVAVVANLVLNLVLIPPLSEDGAAIAIVATVALMIAVQLPATRRLVGGLPVLRIVAGPIMAALAMAGTGAALGAGALSIVPAGIVFVAVLLLIERRFFPDDAERVLRIVRPRGGGSDAPGRAGSDAPGPIQTPPPSDPSD